MKLRTLKDCLVYAQIEEGKDKGVFTGLSDPKILRQEAIKWIKSIRENKDCKGCPVDKVPKGIFSEFGGCPAGDPQGCGLTWGLMLFFNITNEELK